MGLFFSSTVHRAPTMSLVMNSSDFTHILRVLSTNVDGKQKVSFAMTAIKGVGRRFADVCCKKADIDVQKRAGELTNDEIERLVTVIQNPQQFKIPVWMLNRRKDHKDGKHSQVIANAMESKLREDLERMKKIRAHRGLSTPRRRVVVVALSVCLRSVEVKLLFVYCAFDWIAPQPNCGYAFCVL